MNDYLINEKSLNPGSELIDQPDPIPD
jgi:hypothetical protein